MAKVKFSGIGITNMRGRLGTDTISRNAHGNYSKTAAYGSGFPETQPFYQAFSTAMLDAVSMWLTLDPAIQALWNIAASEWTHSNSIGEKSRLRGYDLFRKQTAGLIAVSVTPPLLPLPKVEIIGPTNIDIDTVDSSNVIVNVKWPTGLPEVPDFHSLVVCASPCVSGGVTRKTSGISVCYIFSALDPTDPLDLTFAYVPLHGSPIVGRKIFFKAYVISHHNGMRSPFVTNSALVV